MSRARQGQVLDSHKPEIRGCRVVELKLNNVPATCLLDTGSQVSTVTDKFFREHLLGDDNAMLSTSSWLKLTVANGLEIPYQGYVELEVQTMGVTIPKCGFLVLKCSDSVVTTEHCILGMNVIHRCQQQVNAEFETVLGGTLDSGWRNAFQQLHTCTFERKAMARVASRNQVQQSWLRGTCQEQLQMLIY